MGDWLQDRCNAMQKAQQEHIQKSFGSDIEKAKEIVKENKKDKEKDSK